MEINKLIAANLKRKHRITFFPKISGSVAVENGSALIECFSQHLPGKFMPLGAYSYTQSFFSHVTRVGRYCSIGANVEVIGNNHPVNWVSASPVFYRRGRANQWKSNRETFLPFQDQGPLVENGPDLRADIETDGKNTVLSWANERVIFKNTISAIIEAAILTP
jgi:acetyltransferase-like isoleucine patch superfamily enzyme